MTSTLIIFTRFPEPGQTKTRLISDLGAVGAARMQSELAHWSLRITENADAFKRVVYVSGAPLPKAKQWLKTKEQIKPQTGGDLGNKMRHAFEQEFQQGAKHVAIIGIDAPELNNKRICEALNALKTADVVIIPAEDGGYGLLALKKVYVPLFEKMPWGTANVCEETVSRCRRMNLKVVTLAPTWDVDYAEDIERFFRVQRNQGLSVIIPTFNEEDKIQSTLESVKRQLEQSCHNQLEVVVADGRSQDNTRELAKQMGVVVVACERSRGEQLASGCVASHGGHLLFLHADTQLPQNAHQIMETVLMNPHQVAGTFAFGVHADGLKYRMLEQLVALRCLLRKLPYGDQGLFLRRSVYDAVGGFNSVPLLEDVDMVRRLKRMGAISIDNAKVKTSARRWHQRGVLKTTLLNQAILTAFDLGVKPQTLVHWYRSNV